MGSTAVMNLMLGWLKGVANWVLSLFNLAGSTGFSPLAWLSENWLIMLIVLLSVGVVMDIVIWLIRWRPHWVWFNKKRIIIHDDDFFEGEDLVDAGLYDPGLFEEETMPAQRKPANRRRPATVPARRKKADADFDTDDLFSVDASDTMSDGGEDDVFNVSDLPVSDDEIAYRNSRKRS